MGAKSLQLMGFPRQEINPESPMSPTLAGGFFTTGIT